jgi:hypothetical protein
VTEPRSIIAAAVAARTITDVDQLEEAMRTLGVRREAYLGDRRANWSAVAGGADPRTAPFERVTNMFDAVLELEAQRRQDVSCVSPQEAAHRFLAVPAGGAQELTDAEARRLAARCRVTLHDSDDPKRTPTIAFRDYGIGLSRAEMPTTILSLEGSNKLDKFYLHGLFGKGGSVACMYSAATVFISRKHPQLLQPDEEDRVSVAVVRRDDREDVRLPFFRYLANPDGTVFSAPASEVEFEPGTLVLHVNYQADKLGTSTWQQEESIYALAETNLFRPTLPYLLADERTGEANRRPEGRGAERLMGLGRRLDKVGTPEGLKRRGGPAELDVPNLGKITVRWWLFESIDRVRRGRLARGYHTLFMTGGQVHHSWDRQGFVTRVEGRKRVAAALIVEVDLDAIPQKKRVTIFSSFRDRMIHSSEAVALEHAVADWLGNDPDLGEAERELVREALSSSGNGVSRQLRNKLNSLIRQRIPSIMRTAEVSTPRPPKPRQEEDLHPEPTILTGPEQITVLPGKPKSIYLQLNAHDGFIPDLGEFDIVPRTPAVTLSFSRGALRAGRLQASVTVDAATPLGQYQLDATVSWVSARGGYKAITWPILATVVSAITPHPPGREPRPRQDVRRQVRQNIGVALIWAKDRRTDWDDQVAGNLEDITGSELAAAHPESYGELDGIEAPIPTIVLNEHFTGWREYKRRTLTGGTSDRMVSLRKDKYALSLGVTIANLCQQERKLRRAHLAWEDGGRQIEEPTRPMEDEQLRRAIAEAAYGTLAFLLDMDKFLADLDTHADNEPAAAVG